MFNNPILAHRCRYSKVGSPFLFKIENKEVMVYGLSNHKGIQAVEPFQEHLDIHLLARQKAAVAEGPIGTGQTGLHDPGCPANRYQRHKSDHQMGREQGEAVPQLRIWPKLKIWR